MKQNRPFARAAVTRKAQKLIEEGHPWVYDTEITGIEGGCENGGLSTW